MKEQHHNDLWIRWAPETWKGKGGWKTSIQENTLQGGKLVEALFILQDYRCVFVSMDVLRMALNGKKSNYQGTIVFEINPSRRSIDGKRVKMDVVISRTHRQKVQPKMMEGFTPN